ncbi:hypothetical protein KCP69_10000 [Salmonella enterica subsp. enterica]|nr:hypothetical protein KCP69_10000 [Salmonella enterica subsp. enterica]
MKGALGKEGTRRWFRIHEHYRQAGSAGEFPKRWYIGQTRFRKEGESTGWKKKKAATLKNSKEKAAG